MADTNVGQIGYGTQFGTGTSGFSGYSGYANVLGIKPAGIEVGEVDTTVLASPGGAREFKKGLINGGEIEVTLLYNKAQISTLFALVGATAASYVICFPDTGSFVFTGFLKHFTPPTAAPEDKLETTLTFKITGLPTFA